MIGTALPGHWVILPPGLSGVRGHKAEEPCAPSRVPSSEEGSSSPDLGSDFEVMLRKSSKRVARTPPSQGQVGPRHGPLPTQMPYPGTSSLSCLPLPPTSHQVAKRPRRRTASRLPARDTSPACSPEPNQLYEAVRSGKTALEVPLHCPGALSGAWVASQRGRGEWVRAQGDGKPGCLGQWGLGSWEPGHLSSTARLMLGCGYPAPA